MDELFFWTHLTGQLIVPLHNKLYCFVTVLASIQFICKFSGKIDVVIALLDVGGVAFSARLAKDAGTAINHPFLAS